MELPSAARTSVSAPSGSRRSALTSGPEPRGIPTRCTRQTVPARPPGAALRRCRAPGVHLHGCDAAPPSWLWASPKMGALSERRDFLWDYSSSPPTEILIPQWPHGSFIANPLVCAGEALRPPLSHTSHRGTPQMVSPRAGAADSPRTRKNPAQTATLRRAGPLARPQGLRQQDGLRSDSAGWRASGPLTAPSGGPGLAQRPQRGMRRGARQLSGPSPATLRGSSRALRAEVPTPARVSAHGRRRRSAERRRGLQGLSPHAGPPRSGGHAHVRQPRHGAARGAAQDGGWRECSALRGFCDCSRGEALCLKSSKNDVSETSPPPPWGTQDPSSTHSTT